MSARYDYSEWDGTQEFADLDPDDLLAGLTDELLEKGDLDDALRRLLRSGFRNADGDQVPGLRDLLDQLRRRRAEMLAEGDPDGRMAELHAPARRDRGGRARRHRRAGGGGARLGRPAARRGDRRRRHRAAHGARPPARRPGRAHQQPAALRLRLLRGPRALRGAGGGAAPRDGRHLLRGRLRRAVQHGPRADGAHARRLRRAEHHARAARARRRARPELRGVHGAVRGHVPGQPADPRRAPGAAGRAHGRGPGGVELA